MAKALLPQIAALLLLSSGLVTSSPTAAKWGPWGGNNDMSGCGKLHDSGYSDASSTNSIVSGNRTRTFGIYVPTGYNASPSQPRKLILDYHGNDGTPEQQYNNSRYFANPEGEQYIAVYPAGVEEHWQSAPYAIKGVNDLQFTTDLVAYLRTEYCIDSNHIYASGKSNGAGFVDFLACSDNGNEFAAFAMASAALYSDNAENQCSGGRPRAILESHGQNDTTISYYGGPRGGGNLPYIRDWIQWWAERDGCDPSTDETDSGNVGGYEIISYSCNGYKDIVQHYDVFDLGHCWPSINGDNSDSSRSYCHDHVLDFTSVVVNFFARWQLSDFGYDGQPLK